MTTWIKKMKKGDEKTEKALSSLYNGISGVCMYSIYKIEGYTVERQSRKSKAYFLQVCRVSQLTRPSLLVHTFTQCENGQNRSKSHL